jgi:Fic family protein
MSYGFNSIQLTEPQTTEWTREASAAYDRSMTGRSAADTLNPSREPRWHEVRNMHGKVWRRANSPRGRI